MDIIQSICMLLNGLSNHNLCKIVLEIKNLRTPTYPKLKKRNKKEKYLENKTIEIISCRTL